MYTVNVHYLLYTIYCESFFVKCKGVQKVLRTVFGQGKGVGGGRKAESGKHWSKVELG